MKTKKNKKKLTQKQRVQKLVKENSTLELFLRALTQIYPLDKLAPGIVLSALPPANTEDVRYYASVVRYDLDGVPSPANLGKKQTLVSVTSPTLELALTTLMREWQGKIHDASLFFKTQIRRYGKKV